MSLPDELPEVSARQDGRMSFVEMEDERMPTQEYEGAKPPRLHHLDWIRMLMIAVAVFLHCWQILVPERPVVVVDNTMFPVFNESSDEYALLNQDNPDWKQTDYSWRYIIMGRQFAIPLLFWVSGCSLGIGKGEAGGSIKKVGMITLLGCVVNGIIWTVGPMDTLCSYQDSLDSSTTCSGLLLNWVIAPGGGLLFGVLFQFWFTFFLMMFLGEVIPLWSALRQARDAADAETWSMPAAPLLKQAGLHVGIVSVVYIVFSFWLEEDPDTDITRLPHAIYLSLMEIPFVFSLLMSCSLPASRPVAVRLFQYIAAAVGLIQFSLLSISKEDLGGADPPLDGRFVLYFHMFRQMMSLGYVQMLTRSKTAPIVSRAYPVMIFVLLLTASSTNYYRGGVDTYPFFPYLPDRLMYTGGSWIQLFIHDRLGNVFAKSGFSEPLPHALGFGALLAYMFHPVAIVLGIELWTELHPLIVAALIMGIFVLIAALVGLNSRRGRAK